MITHSTNYALRVLAVASLVAIVATWFTVPQLVESAYQGRSWAFFNELIEGQNEHTLQEYLNVTTHYLVIFSFAGLTVSAALFALGFERLKDKLSTVASTRIELLPGLLILFIALARVFAELTSFQYDWDIDHMMYFGGRLLAGDMHWTVEFDDKLPVVQALFALPAMAHSIRAWQVMSVLIIAAGCASVYTLLFTAIRDYLPELHRRAVATIAFYTAVLTFCSYALLPGDITHINPAAASLAIMAIAFADVARLAFHDSKIRFYIFFLFGTLSASVAIGIRPYFLYPLVLAGFWAALKVGHQPGENLAPMNASIRRLTTACVLTWGVGWIFVIGFFGLVANAFPYLVMGRLDVLQAGLEMLAQKLNPQGPMSVLKAQVHSILHIPELVALVFAAWGISTVVMMSLVRHHDDWRFKRNALLDIGYLLILCPLLLELAILTRHFWPHYLQLFVPFMALGAGWIGAHLIAQGFLELSRVQMRLFVLIGLVVITISAKEEIAYSVNTIVQFSHSHPQAKQLDAFQRYLATRVETRRDFLNPTGMYFHWQLGEPRHGFPHAANTGHIMRGWWRTVEVPEVFHLPTNRSTYCEMLEEKGPSVLVELGKSDVTECFSQKADSKYVRVNVGMVSAASDLWIFERINCCISIGTID